ncbi:MAG TPA: hypothetical protein QF480_06965 [Bacteroidales bacterium]|jgi:hypothetical protein|nr:hypothetical protein [Bacteroidota bacterium]HJN06340.1 hypothetical protein [Bacteroidales bacterium]|tara:strand:- start:2240 stop:3373 length:1134 start_codon:yes stop_codon:yes gene_type:complete
MEEHEFDEIRPYNDQEIRSAIPRILADNAFHHMMDYLFTPEKKKIVISNVKKANNITEFQRALTLEAVLSILDKTTEGITHSGFENINNLTNYVYLGTHRDIVLDSSILGLVHLILDYKIPQSVWGSNLMVSPLVVDLGKSNQMITVFREGSPKELLLNSQRLSTYIRKSIAELNKSVWIAHRKGRAKNGFDKTDVSILKMLTLSGDTDIKSWLTQLNIVPVAMSYEWEPCDSMKVREIYLSMDSTYVKSDDEDLNSMIGGLTGEKGRIHLSLGTPINNEILKIDNRNINNNEFISMVAEIVDNQIYNNYKLWPSNYLAYDLLNNSTEFNNNYNDETRVILENRYAQTTKISQHENDDIRKIFLLLYANPLINKLKL